MIEWTSIHVTTNRPTLTLEVENADAANALIDFSSAGTVWLHAWDRVSGSQFVGSGVGTGGTSSLSYKFGTAQTSTSRLAKAVFEVRYANGDIDFQPRDGFIEFPLGSLP